ncbi:MAG: SpoIID/LytB domain-containing protein [Candidatus Eremiobacteraeota bacterium]|nr:SpoIID/LytB domain-containing protein [Candidatus Eremiobacteraeota bacterium]MBV8497657.1 SpoIID/LytB domain-containing protein [Candidatus Eremiobacteraeota bacterium]
MRRRMFLVLGAAPLFVARAARAQSDADPSSWSRKPALRVLLGSGAATAVGGDLFTFAGRPYRGTFTRLDDGRIVNLVDLEEYLYSVVSREMSARWPIAALEVQSICARTYVLQRSDPRREYDLIPSELDQRYDGVAGETPGGTAAVDATTGQVLKYGDAFATIAYSSCCGGHTEASSDAWGAAPIPYLEGVVCTWCSASPNYRWSTALPLEQIAGRLSTYLGPIGTLQDLRVTQRDPSGRARGFELVGDGGSAVVSGAVFRRAVGSRVLPSLLIERLERDGGAGQVSVDGGGLGHGVGLCQWGARGMALAGRQPAEILPSYFPGAVLAHL